MRSTFNIPAFVRKNLEGMKAKRLKKDLGRTDLYRLTGINRTSLRDYEEGLTIPRLETYNKLAEVFGWKKWEA